MTFRIIILFILVSLIALISGLMKKNRRLIIISSISLVMFLVFGIGVFMALGSM